MGIGYTADFGDYLRYELGRRPGTVRQYLWRLGYLEGLTGKPAHQITSSDLRAIKKDWKKSTETLKSLIVAMRAFHLWGALEGHWPQNGITLVRTPTVDSDESCALSPTKTSQLLRQARSPYEIRLIMLGLYAGTRIGESARMTREHLDEIDGVLRFEGKGGKRREVPVHPLLDARLPRIFASPPLHPSSLQKIKERLAERAGVEFVAHQLRKTFATVLQDAGVEEKVIENLLGHKGSVTRRYAPVTPRMRQQAVSAIDYREEAT